MHHHHYEQHHRHGQSHASPEAKHISEELRGHQYTQARRELTNEFLHNPREAQRLLHQIGNDLRAHGYRGIGVELDRHNNVTHVDFNHHNIYSGLGREHHESSRHHGRGKHGDASPHEGGPRGRERDSQQPDSRTDRSARPQDPPKETSDEVPNPFKAIGQQLDKAGHAIEKGLDQAKKDLDRAGHDISENLKHFGERLGDQMAHLASNVANRLGTVGDCAHGPRLVFDKLGYHLPPMVATEQGRHVRDSGLFDRVPRSEVRAGDYGVRDWNRAVTRAHGQNKGDSFIVTSVGRHGQLHGANDHHFAVPEDGGRYRNLTFYRPNARFYALMKEQGKV